MTDPKTSYAGLAIALLMLGKSAFPKYAPWLDAAIGLGMAYLGHQTADKS